MAVGQDELLDNWGTRRIVIITHCQALVYMNSLKLTNSHITCWFNLIQEFDMEVRHRAGSAILHAVALSQALTEYSSDTLDYQ